MFVRQLTDAVMTFTVLVDSAGMLEGRRIRVSLGEHHSFTAVMKDDAFNSRIVAGDILVVDLRVVQRMAGGTLLVEREIVKVREHRPNHCFFPRSHEEDRRRTAQCPRRQSPRLRRNR